MSYAATNFSSKFDPFQPYPVGVTVKEKGEIKSFMDGKNKNHKLIASILDKVPKLEVLIDWAKKGKLKENLDELNTLAYPLIRWILASNRAHLKRLNKNEVIYSLLILR